MKSEDKKAQSVERGGGGEETFTHVEALGDSWET